MKKVTSISFTFNFVKDSDSHGVNRAFDRIFRLASKKMMLDSESTKEYSDINDRNWAIRNTRGGSKEVEGRTDNCIQDVQVRQDTSSEIWRTMEDKQRKTDQVIKVK